MWYLPKDYVWVHTRVEKFHDEHTENMWINTEFKLDWNVAIFKATVVTKKWTFTWSSFWEVWKEKAFEKLETVAVWRALAFAWYEVKSWIASSEEMEEFSKKDFKKQDIMEFIDRVKEEDDTDVIKAIFKEFNELKWSDKQVAWMKKECRTRVDLLDNIGWVNVMWASSFEESVTDWVD